MAVTATLSLSYPPPTDRMRWAGTIDMKNMVESIANNDVVWNDDPGDNADDDDDDAVMSIPKRRANEIRINIANLAI